MKLIRSKSLLIALAASLCIVGTVGCGGPEVIEPAPSTEVDPAAESAPTVGGAVEQQVPIDKEKLQAELGEESIGAEIGAIASTHKAYADSIQNNLLAPLNAIANEPESNRTIQFIEDTELNIAQVQSDVFALSNSVGAAISAVNVATAIGDEAESSDVTQLSVLGQNLENLRTDIQRVNDVILSPLTSLPSASPEGPAKVEDIFVSFAIAEVNTVPISEREEAIRQLQTALSDSLEGVTLDANGIYENNTSNAIRSFIETQNELIAEQVESIVSAVPSSSNTDSSSSSTSWLALTALLFGILNTLGIAWIFFLLQRRRKWQEQLARTLSSDSTRGQFTASNDTQIATALRRLEQQVARNEENQNRLFNNVQNIHKAVTDIASSTSTASQPVSSYSDYSSNYSDIPNYEKAQEPQASRSTAKKRAKQSHQDISNLPRIATVEMTRDSQEKIWVGKNVAAVFSVSSRGDYWIVSPDNQRFYIILKDKALLNANNLKTLKILYDFVDQSKLSSLQRRYDKPAEVKPLGGDEWELVRSGKLTFY
ncbi:MAG: hypothetical protein AAF716_11050 [Cyanobacteria bacterium P01_D01_bin.1]